MYARSAGLVPITPETGTAAFVFRARVIRMFTVPAACTTLFHLGSVAVLRLESAIGELGVAVRAEEQQVLEVVVGRVPVEVVDLELSDGFISANGAL